MPISVIIVTQSSSLSLQKTIESLQKQTTPPSEIIIIDNASSDSSYLKQFESLCRVIYSPVNLGFCAANNLGWRNITHEPSYVLFLNPDAFLAPTFMECALAFMEKNSCCGALSAPLFGYDFVKNEETKRYDSTGVFSTWYGRWYDRDQGRFIDPRLRRQVEEVPALCGALMFCRKKALEESLLPENQVWESAYFMYKDDIELSLRLKKKGWKLMLLPSLAAYHGRGWSKKRSEMSRSARLYSARNEVALNWKFGNCHFLPYSFLKYVAVKLLDI
jgi:N-acetylglucosaminyl-diphospho-decaprenol L-rhamnosyltransferase